MIIFAPAYEHLSELWCNGNTADFGSVVLGSSPGSSTHKGTFSGAFVVFCRDWHSLRLLLKWKSCILEQAQLHTSILTPSAMVCQSYKMLCCREVEGLPRKFCEEALSIDNKAGVSTFADGFVAFVSGNGKGETATVYSCQNCCGSDCCAER